MISKTAACFKTLFGESRKVQAIAKLDSFGRRKVEKNKKASFDGIKHKQQMVHIQQSMERDRLRSMALAALEKLCQESAVRASRSVIKQFLINSRARKIMLKFFGVCFEIGKGKLYKSWSQWQNLPDRNQGFISDCNSFRARLRLYVSRKIKKSSLNPIKKYLQLGHTKMKIACTKLFNVTMEGQIKQAVQPTSRSRTCTHACTHACIHPRLHPRVHPNLRPPVHPNLHPLLHPHIRPHLRPPANSLPWQRAGGPDYLLWPAGSNPPRVTN